MVIASGNHLGYTLKISDVYNNIFIPKYYNPEIFAFLEDLSTECNLISLQELIQKKYLSFSTGDEIGKMAYGTGDIPFIRTSDISNWEIRTDPKQGVSKEIYNQYVTSQDVRAGDIFFVRDGTYLIGQSCLLTDQDLPCLYQSHILKFRVSEKSPISSPLLLACLNSPIVKWQIRSKQFTADIIDSLGHRFKELILPIPKSKKICKKIGDEVQENINNRIALREQIRKIPLWNEGILENLDQPIPDDWSIRAESGGNAGFLLSTSQIKDNIFIPKYYDPRLEEDIDRLRLTHDLIPMRDLVNKKIIQWSTGIEVGKMAYGTGNIPFIRTSDISNWELKADPKQCVSEEIYQENRQDVKEEDIFVVRDGTYLVGTSCILTEDDTKILYCGGLYKIRVNKKDDLDPYLLLALINSPIVIRQVRAKQFTRDIIDTIGKRLFEIILPLPKNGKLKEKIANKTREVIKKRVELRDRSMVISNEIQYMKHPLITEEF